MKTAVKLLEKLISEGVKDKRNRALTLAENQLAVGKTNRLDSVEVYPPKQNPPS